MLSLKIDNQFIALPDSTEISIEASNPIFFDAGAKTYLFEVPVESLRYIIGNADEIYGESLYDVLEGKRAEIYIDGVQFFSGVVNLEDEISIEDGKIAVSIASGNLEFAQMIEGMNCRDLEQAEEVIVGYKYTDIDAKWTMHDDVEVVQGDVQRVYNKRYNLPDEFTVVRNSDLPGDNISDPYPVRKHCTIRAAYATSKTITSEVHNYINHGDYSYPKKYNDQIKAFMGSVFILGASRRNSGICFYVNYFIQCLAHTLKVSITDNSLTQTEDFNRLAFVNMRCKTKAKDGSLEVVDFRTAREDIGGIDLFRSEAYSLYATANRYKAIATSDNFPDSSVSDVIESLAKGFGVKIIHYSESGEMRLVLIRDILRDNAVSKIPCTIFSAEKVSNHYPLGFKLTYGHNEEDHNYTLPIKNAYSRINSYAEIAQLNNPFDFNTYIDERNGNAYAIKVEEEADSSGDEKNLLPSLFEVGGYSSVEYGDCSNEELVETYSIGFAPIINIDADGASNKRTAVNNGGESNMEMVYALLIDKEIEHTFKSFEDTKTIKIKRDKQRYDVTVGTGFNYYDFLGSNSDFSTDSKWFPANNETEVNSYETGLMLGIMRGPGSDAEPETFDKDFDGEGNYRVAFTAANYAFTSDSIDNCNRDFDYNGTASGVGPDELKGRFSLKLRAAKYNKDGSLVKDADGIPITIPSDRANRGLYDTFWKEYAHFTINKKIIRITCGMEVADIANIDWTKRYKIGEWCGFIAGYSFNVNKNGMSEVELELYYL